MLKEFFGGISGYLPEGSIVLFGSLSHLARRGIENYAEECVKTKKVILNMIPKSCVISHAVLVPLGGCGGEALVRDLYDLDSWIRGGGRDGDALPDSRAKFWKIALDDMDADRGNLNGTRVLFMPESMSNSNKKRTVAGILHVNLPARISAISAEDEGELIHTMMHEINDTYAMNLDEHPILDRSSGSDMHDMNSSCGRIFVIGASHAKKMVGGLEILNMDIIDLSRPGWKADPESLDDIAAKLTNYNLCDSDTIVIDILSNSVVCGTGNRGKIVEPIKIDGEWHIPGSLTFEPKTVLKSTLSEAADKVFAGKCPKLICITPLPRYVTEKCCDSPDHIQNFSGNDFFSDINQNSDEVEELISGWAQSINSRSEVLNFRMVADDPEQELPDLTVHGVQMWAPGDPVHGSGSYYREMATLVSETIRSTVYDDGESLPPSKRLRLESVIVKREGESKRVRKSSASWSTGKLPPLRGRGGPVRGPRGSRPFSHRGRFQRGRAHWRGNGGSYRAGRGRGRGGL
jgi:hypothetical protein